MSLLSDAMNPHEGPFNEDPREADEAAMAAERDAWQSRTEALERAMLRLHALALRGGRVDAATIERELQAAQS